jgi:hypothetical protein
VVSILQEEKSHKKQKKRKKEGKNAGTQHDEPGTTQNGGLPCPFVFSSFRT